jgi:hypothetical protein
MDIQSIVEQLRQEVSRIERAIAAIAGLGSQPARLGRLPKRSQAKPTQIKKGHRMSAAGRKRISAAMKQRWANWKGKSAPKKAPASKKTSGRKPMSAAMRKKLSMMMKARWAAKKKSKA